ncbi:hypothetical protein [Pseudomonas syringae]|uniref:hypothetical protein n=1 Tax=Pseudomonas syringae TaxID=317 RepID=UPI0018E64BD6|nr:hypothetical protein [Pseudomonas syringae]MBI6794941.1 hypothetical protein [Pseudomonas syringae]
MTTETPTTPPDEKSGSSPSDSAAPAPDPAAAPETHLQSSKESLDAAAQTSTPIANEPVEPPPKPEPDLNRKLITFHLVVLVMIGIIAYAVAGKYEAGLFWGAILAIYSLLLTSFGSLTLKPAQQKVIVILGLVVASAGAFMYVEGLKATKEAGSNIDKVVFDFRATQYKLEPMNQTPCAPAGDGNPLHYTCDVVVTPLVKPAP